MTSTEDASGSLTPAERDWLATVEATADLAELATVTGAGSEHQAYLEAKSRWRSLRGKQLAGEAPEGLPGDTVEVGERRFHVHGVTHADTAAEREFLREQLVPSVEAGEELYCEQGIRRMYFDDLPAACGMDDLTWAIERCRELEESRIERFDGVGERFDDLRSEFREAAFSLIGGGDDARGREFRAALGDVASALLTDHEGLATGEEFESFRLTRAAATDPSRLADLQRYYARAFLPQPLEREWLRRHDPELELFTHARNERMADYAVYHAEAETVRLVVGAAHQPGVVYYLQRHRDGDRDTEGFEPMG